MRNKLFSSLVLSSVLACPALPALAQEPPVDFEWMTPLLKGIDPKGIDDDKNGIRDDFDSWLKSSKDPKDLKNAYAQYAKIAQKIMVGDPLKLKGADLNRKLKTELFSARSCLAFHVREDYIKEGAMLDRLFESVERAWFFDRGRYALEGDFRPSVVADKKECKALL